MFNTGIIGILWLWFVKRQTTLSWQIDLGIWVALTIFGFKTNKKNIYNYWSQNPVTFGCTGRLPYFWCLRMFVCFSVWDKYIRGRWTQVPYPPHISHWHFFHLSSNLWILGTQLKIKSKFWYHINNLSHCDPIN